MLGFYCCMLCYDVVCVLRYCVVLCCVSVLCCVVVYCLVLSCVMLCHVIQATLEASSDTEQLEASKAALYNICHM